MHRSLSRRGRSAIRPYLKLNATSCGLGVVSVGPSHRAACERASTRAKRYLTLRTQLDSLSAAQNNDQRRLELMPTPRNLLRETAVLAYP